VIMAGPNKSGHDGKNGVLKSNGRRSLSKPAPATLAKS